VKKQLWYGALFAAVMMSLMCNAHAEPPKTVATLDVDRYVGKWYEIARFPNSYQRRCVRNVTAEYVKRTDGKISVINRCNKVDGAVEEVTGIARVMGAVGSSKLEVLFAPEWLSWVSLAWADYWVLDLAPDYSVAVIGEPTRESLWILSRTPQLPAATYEELVNRVTAQGYDTSRLVKTTQGQ
jgi:apolipoprotein D and lipocalin family protein